MSNRQNNTFFTYKVISSKILRDIKNSYLLHKRKKTLCVD